MTDPLIQPDLVDRPGEASMGVTTIAILLGSVALATTGQLLLKAGMNEVGQLPFGASEIVGLLRSVLSTWQLLAGLVSFGASAVLWLVTLSRVPLSTAYPIVSLSYVLILGFSTLVLGERPSATVWTGAVLIMFGVSLIGLGRS